MTTRFFSTRWLMLPLALLLFSTTGCDSTGSEPTTTITLPTLAEVEFCFRFNANDIRVGRLEDITAEQSADLSSYLQQNGNFSKADIVSATIKSAEVLMLQPLTGPTSNLDFVNKVILKLNAQNISDLEVAESDDFSATRQKTLGVRADRDIASYIDRTNFSAIMQLDASTLEADEDYEMAVVLRIQVEVEG